MNLFLSLAEGICNWEGLCVVRNQDDLVHFPTDVIRIDFLADTECHETHGYVEIPREVHTRNDDVRVETPIETVTTNFNHFDSQDREADGQVEDAELVSRARAVGISYEYAKAGTRESTDEYQRRRRRNQRKKLKEERRLSEVIGDLPPPPPTGSSQQEDEAYRAIRAFEVEQMTYDFGCCYICKERRMQTNTRSGNCCNRCKRDKHEPKLWSNENNMDPGLVPEELTDLTDAEQMLIARIAPAIHVHMLKHGGIAAKGHCIAFPQAVQEPATILPRLPVEVDIIRVRRQGRDDTHKDFRVRRRRVEDAIRWLKENNPAYSDIIVDDTRIQNLPEDGELPELRTVEFSGTQHENDQGPAPEQLDTADVDEDAETVSGVLLPEPGVDVQEQIQSAVNQLVSDNREPETDDGDHQRVAVQRPVIPWPTTDSTPASEFTTPYFFYDGISLFVSKRKG